MLYEAYCMYPSVIPLSLDTIETCRFNWLQVLCTCKRKSLSPSLPPSLPPSPETLMEEDCTSLSSSCLLDPELHGIPVAKASGQVTVRVKLKQNEAVVGPKLEVDGFLGSLHLLFSPQQLSMLLEMTSGILNEG